MRVDRVRDLLARLHARPRRRLTLLVGLDGTEAGGRRELAGALLDCDPQLQVVRLSHFPGETEESGPDWRRLRSRVLLQLVRGAPAEYEDEHGRPRRLTAGGMILVEGLGACRRQLAASYDYRIWVERSGQRRPPEVEQYLSEHAADRSADLRADCSDSLRLRQRGEFLQF